MRPDNADAQANLGNVLRELGQWEAAEASGRRSIALAPDFAEAHGNFGASLGRRRPLPATATRFR